nr:hypothetical protein [Pandoravirus massiliensis]
MDILFSTALRLAASMVASSAIVYVARAPSDIVRPYFRRALFTDHYDDEAHADPSAVLIVLAGFEWPVKQKPLTTQLHPHGPRVIYLALDAQTLQHPIDAAYLFYGAKRDAAIHKDVLERSPWLSQTASTRTMRACAVRAKDYKAVVCMTITRDGHISASPEGGDPRAVARCAYCRADHLCRRVDRLHSDGCAMAFSA